MNQKYLRIYRYIAAVVVCASCLTCTGCTPRVITPAEESVEQKLQVEIRPIGLTAEPGNQRMTLQWKRMGDGLFSGYNIYISEQPLGSGGSSSVDADTVTPFNLSPYPGDTDPSDGLETFEAEGLKNGLKYFVSVRVINPDRTESTPSNEVMVVCGPRGEIRLDARFAGGKDGYSLSKAQYVRADSPENDLYFYHKDGTDFLASPSRLGGYARVTGFAKLTFKGELHSLRLQLGKGRPNPTDDRIEVRTGDWIMLARSDNTYAVVNVRGFEGTARERKINLFFAYCPLEGATLF